MLLPLSIHVVFGQVLTGQEIIKTIENQRTDPNNRPVSEVKMMNCGELIPKAQGIFLLFSLCHVRSNDNH